MCERLERHRFFLLILVGYLILGFAYSLVNPLFESPDEALNYANIRYLVEKQRLPVLEPGEPTKAHHPPLYYVLGALFTFWVPNERFEAVVERVNPFWAYQPWEPGVDNKSLYLHDPRLEGFPYRDVALGVHMVRYLSLLIGAGTVLCVYGTAWELVGDHKAGDHKGRPYVAVGAAALAAFNPMFVFITTSVHDDALANLVAAATLYVTARLLVRGTTVWRAVVLGLLVGLGFLTKLTCPLVVPTVGLALLWRPLADRGRAGWREAARLAGIVLGLSLLVGGWWFARNLLLYGEPTSMVYQTGVWGVRANAPDLAAAARELGFLHDTLWGVFGYGQIPMPHWVYGLTRVLGLTAGGGLVLFWFHRRSGRIPWECPPAVFLILVSGPLVAFAVNFARMTVSAAADFGRYLFVTLAALTPLYVLGLSEWVTTRWRDWMIIALTLGMLALAVYGLVGVLAPAYAPPPRYGSSEEVAPQHPLDVTYPELAHLLGYDIAPDPLYPGDTLQVTLYWQALGAMDTDYDYVLFLQAFGREGVKIGERDTHPGLGRYPTSRWQAGEVIADTVPVPLAADALAPAALRLDLGLYPPGGLRLTTADGRDTVSVGPVRLASREQAIPAGNPVAYRLGEGVRLVAWDPEWDGLVRPGETLRFTLYWACDAPPSQALNVFVHLVGEGGELLAQGDGPPLGGNYPTDLWVAGDLLADPREVTLPADLSPGRPHLLVGLYSLQTGERLPPFDEQGTRLPADAVPLAVVGVQR